MSRPIDADALLKGLSERCKWCAHYDHEHPYTHECEWGEAMDRVADASEVEAEPVRHGHWSRGCSHCGYNIGYEGYPKWKYCPACGQKWMR